MILALLLTSNTDVFSCELYKSYITQDAVKWGEVLDSLDANFVRSGYPSTLKKLALGECGYISLLIEGGDDVLAIQTVEKLELHIGVLQKYANYTALAKSLKGSVLAYKAYLNPSMETIYGPASLRAIDKAIASHVLNLHM